MKMQMPPRPSPIAGQWYPGDRRSLVSVVDDYIQGARPVNIQGKVVAVVSPHAGYLYSGPVAGYAYAALEGMRPEVAAVVSPMHYPYGQPLLTSAHVAYETPLGSVAIAHELLDELDSRLNELLGFGLSRIANDPEHSLEIQLPFLQRALRSSFKLLPVMVRDQTSRVGYALGQSLAHVLKDRDALMVASTDLSHFYPQHIAHRLDAEVLRCVQELDPQGVLDAELEGKGFACGRGAVAAVLWAAKELGANQVQILKYATSGDVTGDYDRVVGYGAAVVLSAPDKTLPA